MKEKIISDLQDKLKSRYRDFYGLYLFGSQARKTSTIQSDWDIAIIFDRTIDWKFKDEVRSLVYDVMLQHNVVIDSHIYSREEILVPKTPFREMLKSKGIFYAS